MYNQTVNPSEVTIDGEFYDNLSVQSINDTGHGAINIGITMDDYRDVRGENKPPLDQDGVLSALVHPDQHRWVFWTDDMNIEAEESYFRLLGYRQCRLVYVHQVPLSEANLEERY